MKVLSPRLFSNGRDLVILIDSPSDWSHPRLDSRFNTIVCLDVLLDLFEIPSEATQFWLEVSTKETKESIKIRLDRGTMAEEVKKSKNGIRIQPWEMKKLSLKSD
jgi:hypothetical protein